MKTLYNGVNYKVTHSGNVDVWKRRKDGTIFGYKPCQCKKIKEANVSLPLTYQLKAVFLGSITDRIY